MDKERRAKILCVDDDPKSLKLLEALLSPKGYEVQLAENGKNALDKIITEPPDLILLDIMMPGITGYQVLEKLRAEEGTYLTPVVMITALRESEDRIKAIEAGCDDFISKPFDKNELLARVRSLLRIKSLQDELKNNYEKLRELEKMKDNLIHMIVHDLNNPLMVILVRIQLLMKKAGENFTNKQKENLEWVSLATQELKMMIDNLLDINKMEEGQIKLNLESFDLESVTKEIIDQMKIIALEEEQILSLDVSEAMPKLLADKELIRRVVTNLINNALKFTPPKGTVLLKISFNKDEGNFCVQVKDSGSGIPGKFLDKIFDKFIQVEDEKAKRGRGLGLTFCKMAIESHGGRIWVESQPGEGSLFIFTLPAR